MEASGPNTNAHDEKALSRQKHEMKTERGNIVLPPWRNRYLDPSLCYKLINGRCDVANNLQKGALRASFVQTSITLVQHAEKADVATSHGGLCMVQPLTRENPIKHESAIVLIA